MTASRSPSPGTARRARGGRRAIVLTLCAVASLAAVYAARNRIARALAERAVLRQTGFPLAIGALDLQPLGGRLELREVVLSNPPEYEDRRFLRLRSLAVDYDTFSFLRRRPHLHRVAIDLPEVVVVTSRQGERNTARIAGAQAGSAEKRAGKQPYRVDELRIQIGTVHLVDLTGGKRSHRKIVLDVRAVYRDVTEGTDLSTLVLDSVLGQLGPSIAGDVGRKLGGAVRSAGSGAGQVGKGVLDLFRPR